jgi:hypothetical protein
MTSDGSPDSPDVGEQVAVAPEETAIHVESPDIEEPGTEEPGTEEPGTEEPGTEEKVEDS